MSRAWTVARREFRSYFDNATAYVLVVAFLAVALYLGFRSLFAQGAATLRPIFDMVPWLLAVFVPAITMRSLAEERRSGTLEWLMAQPLDEVEMITGKFLGDWFFALVALAGTLPVAVSLLLLSRADPGVMVAQYVGVALLTAEMVAVGLFASSVTKNQITAFIVGAVVSFLLLLAGTPMVLSGLPPSLAGPAGKLSLLTHFQNVARGVVDLRDVVYFVSATGFFLSLAYFMVTQERLSRLRGSFRRLRIGVAAIGVGVVVVNLLGQHIGGRLDLTRNDVYTLSEGTKQVLRRADDVVGLKLVVSEELPPEVQVTVRDLRDFLSDYRRIGGDVVQVEEIHPDDQESRRRARSLGVRPIQFNVVRGSEYQVKRGWLGLAVTYAGQTETLPVVRNTDDLEYRLTSAIASLTAERKRRVAFLTGFGAGGPGRYPELREMLSRSYDVTTRSLEGDSAFTPTLPADSIRVAILAGPTRGLSEGARRALDGFLEAGGSAFVMAEGVQTGQRRPMARPVEANLDGLLRGHGLRLVPAMVYDLRSNQRISSGRGPFPVIQSYPLWPVAMPAGQHLITRDLQQVGMGWARPLEVTDSARVTPLLETTKFAGRRPPQGPIAPDISFGSQREDLSVQLLAAAVEPPATDADTVRSADTASSGGRLVVVGDADFATSNFARASRQNLVFAANAVDWLAQDEALIGIRSKDRSPPPLVIETSVTRQLLRWGNQLGVPLVFVAIGIVRIARRRRLGRKQREGVAA